MSDNEQLISAEAAEKAYEAAAANAVAQADEATPVEAETPAVVETPASPDSPVIAAAPAVTAPAPSPLAFPAKAERAAAPAKAKPAAKPTAVKTAPKLAKKAAKPVKLAKAAKPVTKRAAKPAVATSFKSKPVQFIKESIMPAKKTTAEFIKTVKSTAADVQAKAKVLAAEVQAKAKVAYAKGAEVAGEAAEFTKGNVDAVVASGKILGAGLQELGKTYAAEGKTTFETVTADVKKISEVKSPVELVQTQSDILRRNFDHAIAFNTKTAETMIGLFGEAFAPLSARASLVVAKVKKAA